MSPFRVLSVLLALTALGVSSGAAQGTPSGFREEFLGQFDGSMSKLVALAEAMPEAKYAWSPGEGVMPVAQVYAHIARYNYLYPSSNLGVPAPAGIDMDAMEKATNKVEVVQMLRRSGDHVRQAVGGMSDADLQRPTRLYGRDVQQWAVLFQLLAHMNEHLGQSIAYARMNDVVPPWSR